MKIRIAAILCALMLLASYTGSLGETAQSQEPAILFGTYTYSSAISGRGICDSFYYTDEWLWADPEGGNDPLALISAQLSASSDASETAALLEKLGFSNVEIIRFDSDDAEDCAYVTGTKTVAADSGQRPVRAVVFQSHGYGEKGWLQNMTVNPEEGASEDHAAYAAAATIFLEDYDRMPQEDNALLWLCGLSRGGAVANVASAHLLHRENAPELVCFTFESPATTQREDAHNGRYRCIHNYLSDDDPVTMIPMWE